MARAGHTIERHLAHQRRHRPERFEPLDWLARAHTVDDIRFAHNAMLTEDRPQPAADAIGDALLSAQRRMIFQSPYVIPTADMLDVFAELDRRNIDGEVLTNSRATSPNVMAVSGYERYKPKLIARSLRIFEYQGPHSIHAKSWVLDGDVSMVGSFNFDPRSIDLNTETIFLIHSEPFAQELLSVLDQYKARAIPVDEQGRYVTDGAMDPAKVGFLKTMAIGILKPLSPLFRRLL